MHGASAPSQVDKKAVQGNGEMERRREGSWLRHWFRNSWHAIEELMPNVAGGKTKRLTPSTCSLRRTADHLYIAPLQAPRFSVRSFEHIVLADQRIHVDLHAELPISTQSSRTFSLAHPFVAKTDQHKDNHRT